MKNIYIALIITSSFEPDLTQYDLVINLFNKQYLNNTLVFDKYYIDGSIQSIDNSLESFLQKYPTGNRATISIGSTTLAECSRYLAANNLDILSLSVAATFNGVKDLVNAITYTPLNQYASMSTFMIYSDYQMDHLHILYDNTTTNINLPDFLEQLIIQGHLLNIPITLEYLEVGKTNYNIKPKSMIVMLALTKDLETKFVNKQFLNNIPLQCFILLSTANNLMTDIFGSVPAITIVPTSLFYSTTTQIVYNYVKNNPTGFDYSSYTFYDIIFVLNYLANSNLPITKNNYITTNIYNNLVLPAWLNNIYIKSNLNTVPYGNYAMIFTKNVIINKDIDLFLKYYQGGQSSLPDSYSLFKIVGIIPNNESLINYNEANYYKIYDKFNNKIAVKYNGDIITFPPQNNNTFLNVGKTNQTKFIYSYNENGYFIILERLFPLDSQIPQVNQTMSKIPIKLLYN